jgi:tetratricopeptide (TPR) repeat protein
LADHERRALAHYREGARLSKEGEFAAAADEFQKAVDIDPKLNGAYEELGYVLYRLKSYKESAEASRAAIRLFPDFKPYYNLGLVHYATGSWQEAVNAFRRSLELRDQSHWQDEYSQAYYHMGLSLARTGYIHTEIQLWESSIAFRDGDPITRFEVAILYLCAGRMDAAKEQYRLLKKIDPSLAKELLNLMQKH